MNYHLLLRTDLFSGMTKTEIEQLLQENKIEEKNFTKGDILAYQGQPCNRLIFLLKGNVKAEMSDPSGKVVKVEDIKAPAPLAILFLFGEENRFPVQATATEEVIALVIPRSKVLDMLHQNRKLLKNYLDISATFASRLSAKLHLMSFRTIRQKLTLYLLELSGKQGGDIVILDRSKTELANYFGISRPSLEREISAMQKEGLLIVEKRKITIVQKKQLLKLIQF